MKFVLAIPYLKNIEFSIIIKEKIGFLNQKKKSIILSEFNAVSC